MKFMLIFRFKLGYSGPIDPSSQFRDTLPQGLVLGGPISLATFRSQHGSLVPSLQASRLLKGAGSRRGVQQMAGTSDKVTIEQDRRLVDLPFLQIEQGESVGLPDFDFNVI